MKKNELHVHVVQFQLKINSFQKYCKRVKMIVNLGTPQYTVQDLTLYRNEQSQTAPPPHPPSFLDQTELEAQRAKKNFLETTPLPPSPNLSFVVCNFRYLEIQLRYYCVRLQIKNMYVCTCTYDQAPNPPPPPLYLKVWICHCSTF